MCAKFGHSSSECPYQICFRCGRQGHYAKDCPGVLGGGGAGASGRRGRGSGGAGEEPEAAPLPPRCMVCGSARCKGERWGGQG
jgi:hypothetical protein